MVGTTSEVFYTLVTEVTMRSRALPALVVLAFIAFGVVPGAQKSKALDKSTYFQMESVSNPAISPDGATVLFSRGYVDIMRDHVAAAYDDLKEAALAASSA